MLIFLLGSRIRYSKSGKAKQTKREKNWEIEKLWSWKYSVLRWPTWFHLVPQITVQSDMIPQIYLAFSSFPKIKKGASFGSKQLGGKISSQHLLQRSVPNISRTLTSTQNPCSEKWRGWSKMQCQASSLRRLRHQWDHLQPHCLHHHPLLVPWICPNLLPRRHPDMV